MLNTTPMTYSVAQAAEILGISRALAYELVARNELPSIRLGRRIVIPAVALMAILEQRWVRPAQASLEDGSDSPARTRPLTPPTTSGPARMR